MRSDLVETVASVEGWSRLRAGASSLGVELGGFDDVLWVGERVRGSVLPVVEQHLDRARALADARYGGAMGVLMPVVDERSWPTSPGPFEVSVTGEGSQVLSWSAEPVEARTADAADTAAARSVGSWWDQSWGSVQGAVEEGLGWVGDKAGEVWDQTREAGSAIGDWWQSTTSSMGSWIDEHGAGAREWVGQHVGAFRWLASALRVTGWVVVALGAVATVVLAIDGAMAGALLAGFFSAGTGTGAGGVGGALAGASSGLKVMGVGFALVGAGDFLDTVADWGEGTIDGQELVKQGALEAGLAVLSLVSAGLAGKGLQKLWTHLPDGVAARIEEWVQKWARKDEPSSGPGAHPKDPVPVDPHRVAQDRADVADDIATDTAEAAPAGETNQWKQAWKKVYEDFPYGQSNAKKEAWYWQAAERADLEPGMAPILKGHAFNYQHYDRFSAYEVFIDGPGRKRFKVDGITETETVSLKYTQLADNPTQARRYIAEMLRKYDPENQRLTIADTPRNQSQLTAVGMKEMIGQPLPGRKVLGVPVQNEPPPQPVIDYATDHNIEIREFGPDGPTGRSWGWAG